MSGPERGGPPSSGTGSVFDDVIGQPAAVAELRTAVGAAAEVLDGGPGVGMTHAWLFTGPPGSGRSVAARAFAAALQCPDGGCGRCTACRTALAGTSADVNLVVPEELHLKIKEAREIVRQAAQAPSGGRWMVTVIEDADRLEERTSNVLLKVVEEPPPRCVILLCAPSPEDMLPTIRSRCRQVTLRSPAAAAVTRVLVQRDAVPEPRAAFAARAAQGHIGRARRLATDDEAVRRRREVLSIPTGLTSVPECLARAADLIAATSEESDRTTASIDAAETAELREALGDTGSGRAPRGSTGALKELANRQQSRGTRGRRDALDRALTDLAAFYRDVLMIQLRARVELVHGDIAADVAAVAAKSTPEATLRRIGAIFACRDAIVANVAPLLAVEVLTLALRSG